MMMIVMSVLNIKGNKKNVNSDVVAPLLYHPHFIFDIELPGDHGLQHCDVLLHVQEVLLYAYSMIRINAHLNTVIDN